MILACFNKWLTKPVGGHVANGRLDDVVAGDQQLAVGHDLVQTLLLQVHDHLHKEGGGNLKK